MADDAVELIRLRNNFYRDNYRRLIIVLLLLLLINISLASIIFYQISHKPEPRYFLSSVDGKIMPLYPLDNPMVSPSDLIKWAQKAAVLAYSYSYINYRDELQQLQNLFTIEGWSGYEKALRDSRILDTVTVKKMVVYGEVRGTPVITGQAVANGRYKWRVEMPMLVTYESQTEKTPYPVNIQMIITRVPTVDIPAGIAIDEFVASPGQI